MIPKRPDIDDAGHRFIERTDGYYWRDEFEVEYGPFASMQEARLDMEASDPEYDADFESIEETEAEFGLGWIDPVTGEPGENGAPRLEDH